MVKPILEEDRENAAYQTGRLLAVLADLQRAAHRKEDGSSVNITVVDRFYSATAVAPATTLGRLIGLSNHHLQKLQASDRGGLAGKFKNQIADIHGRIDVSEI